MSVIDESTPAIDEYGNYTNDFPTYESPPASVQPNIQESSAALAVSNTEKEPDKEGDHFVPIAAVNKVMHSVVAADVKITKEAKEFVQECVSEYILFLTGESVEKCHGDNRKTITGGDIISTTGEVGFEDYEPYLRAFFARLKKVKSAKPAKRLNT